MAAQATNDPGRNDHAHDRERHYDSFVVRLWRAGPDGRVVRAQVEHVQSGEVTGNAGVGADWLLSALRRGVDSRSTRAAHHGAGAD